ncbi:MAG: PsbP-related protein, partial [Candidatus Hadarchaeota archaeon]|nr:PsbP-related protein [Candidatus Hadarchaeota archaeon]
MKEIAIISVAVVVLGVACTGYYLLTSEETPPEEVEYETYTNENFSFKFDYPSDWIFREQELPWGMSYFDARENIPENEIGGAFSLTMMEPGSWENEIGPSLDNIRSKITSQIENNENYIMLSGPTDTAIGDTIAFKCSVSIFDPTENTTIR